MKVSLLVSVVAIALIVWLGCAYLAFSRTTLRTIVKLGDESRDLKQSIWTWRYPEWRSGALAGLVIVPLLTVIALVMLPVGEGDEDGFAVIPAMSIPTAMTPSPSLPVTPPDEAATGTPSLPPTAALPTDMSTEVPSSSPMTALPTGTSTRAPTARPTGTSTATATHVPTPTETPTATSTQAPTSTDTPIATSTQAPTSTNTPTATPTETPTATPIPWVVQPEPLLPLLGREYRNPVAFKWSGALRWGQSYQVTVYHFLSGHTLQSDLLSAQEWIADLPAERFGEWRWKVSVVQYGRALATSSEWMFWFDPFPRTPTPSPTPTPTRTRVPSRN